MGRGSQHQQQQQQDHSTIDEEEDSDNQLQDDTDNDDASEFHVSPTKSSPGIPTPSPEDVICGRGKMTSSHPGNRRFRELVLDKKQAYQRARRRDDKTRITFELVQTLREGGSKFLLFDAKTGLWYDVGDEYAREKVSHSLRSRPTENRRTKQKPPRKTSLRKTQHSPAIDKIATQLIHDQQSLLKRMIENDTKGSCVATTEINTEIPS